MTRYKVTMSAELVFEIDATSETGARHAIWESFHKRLPYDRLLGTRFSLAPEVSDQGAYNPQLMTTTAKGEDADWLDVEAV